MERMEQARETRVEFGKSYELAIASVVAGAVVSLGVPAIVLVLGRDMPQGMRLAAVIVGVGVGGLVSGVGAFFGMVMPTSVGGGGEGERAKAEEG